MQEKKIQKMEETAIERMMLLFFLLANVILTVVAVRFHWSPWLMMLSIMGCLFSFAAHWMNIRSYVFRAYMTACLMHLTAIIWSMCTRSFAMTVPVLTMLAVALIFYGIPEITYLSFGVTVFLIIYHILFEKTIDLADKENLLHTFLSIVSVFFIEYIVYVLTKKRIEGLNAQMEIIESLREVERSKDDFMANISHEIRTPINTICGMSEIILREELSDQVRTDVFSIQTAGRSLQSIVSDVLDFTEMQSGKMSLAEENYNITSTINDVINMSMARKSEKKIDLIVDCDVTIPSSLIGDEQKIRRVIMNLVNNALKFTTEGCVIIRLRARKTDYGINLIVSVEDTGIGMKKESLEKLFTNFNQVDTKRNRQKEGIGLGLAISQVLIDMMGGFITVSSEFGKGTQIQFVIPQKVADSMPIASVRDAERVNAAIYFYMERYDRPEVREAYEQMIYHMIVQLNVKCHVCQNLQELKRRSQRETFTHIFISIEKYEEDKAYFDTMAKTSKVAIVIDRIDDSRIVNPQIIRLYKPFFILPIVKILNDEAIRQDTGANYAFQGRFIAPDTTVLVVDDNLMNIRVLEGLLRPYKIRVSIATSGAEALEKIENMVYDVIFMDHMMPEMDGIETLHRIRQKQGNYFKKVPVVAVTANAVGGMREVFLSEGFQDFVAKPIEVSVLERVLRRVLPQEKILPDWGETRRGETADAPRLTDLPAESFDEETGIRYCGGPDAYIGILQLVAQNGREDCDKIGRCYRERDWKNYTTLVHGLKSTMQSIGVKKLSGMAKELEHAGKRGDENYILEHHDEMILEYMRILGLMDESRTVHAKSDSEDLTGLEEIEEAELDQLTLEFEDAAFAFDHDRMEAIAKRLSNCSFRGHSLRDLVGTILHKIEMSDYLSASETLGRIKDKIAESAK